MITSLPIRFVAAEAGFLPPGPCIDFADMVCGIEKRVYKQSREQNATIQSTFEGLT
jgi:hypothetical protein